MLYPMQVEQLEGSLSQYSAEDFGAYSIHPSK
jgi:hypothetical protein